MIGHILRHRAKLIIIILLTLVAIAMQTFIPLLFGEAIDIAIPEKDIQALARYSLIIIAIGIFRGVLSYISGIVNEQVSQNVEMQVRIEFFDNLSSKNMQFFNKAKVGDLMSQATQDTQNMTFAVSPGVRSVVGVIVGLIATVIAMFTLSPILSFLFLLVLPFYIFFMYQYASKLQPISLERQERLAKINTLLQENMTGIRVVRTFSAQKREKEVFGEEVRLYENILIRRGSLSAYFIPTLLLGLVTSILYLVGVYLIEASANGVSELTILGLVIPMASITIGDLIAFIALTGLLLWPTTMLRFLLDATMLGFAGASRIFDTLTTISKLEKGKRIHLDSIKGNISFTDVTFSYDGNQNAIDNLSLVIEQGETVVIIGPTGGGKSTVGRLINRLYDIDRGMITIDGINIADIELSQLRQIVGMIEQDTFLFSTTISKNIAYGIDHIDDSAVVKASKTAQAHDFIMEFKEGYDTIIGERGVTLSGGQKQRVAMARTFITDPPILILDDSTSAVDASTEAKIQSAMDELLKNRTTLIITHRLSTLRKADKILFMRNGRIEASGDHDELITSFEPYRQIFSGYMKLPAIKEVA
jgi:ATP-binding cassette subfamily B protein